MKHFPRYVLPALLLVAGCAKKTDGTFEASTIIEGTAIKVAAQTGGLLLQLNFDEGDDVLAGQTIAVIDTEKLTYQLQQLEANLQDLAVQSRIARTNVQRAKEDFEYAKTKYERFLDLYKKNAASEQNRDDLQVAYAHSSTALETAQQMLASVASKQQAAEAQIKLLDRQIRDALVKAPISGTISTRYFDAGEIVPPNMPVVELIDLSKMWTKIYVSQTYLPSIKIGQLAEISIDGTEQKLRGTVAWISPKAEFTPKNILTQESRTSLVYAVKITVDNPDRILKHGMPVAIRLQPTT